MNILRLTASMDPAMGGPPQGIRNSIPELERLGIRNEVVCCNAPNESWIGRDGFPVHALGPGKFGFAYTSELAPWLDANLHRFDAVIIHGLWLWPSICATRAAGRERARRWAGTRGQGTGDKGQTAEGSGGVDTAAANPSSPQLSALSPPQPLRCFVMPHGMLDPWFQRDKSRRVKAVRNWFYWWLVERHVVNAAHAVLFTCQQELELARTTFRGYRPKREINVGYGIAEPPAFEVKMQQAFAARCPDLDGRPYILFLSRIHPKKNVAALVRAFARVRSEAEGERGHPARSAAHPAGHSPATGDGDIAATAEASPTPVPRSPSPECLPSLVIAGPGWETSYGREVRALIDETNRASARNDSSLDLKLKTSHSALIHAVGMLSGAEKWGSLYGCEAFVLPSHQENFGIAVVEALACGKPVLISNQINIWREIAEDGAGLVEEDTEEGVEKLLRQFFGVGSRQVAVGRGQERAVAPVSSPAVPSTGDGDIAATTPPQSQPSALSAQVSAFSMSACQLFSSAPRACYLKRFAIAPAAARLAEVLKSTP